jgi:hypothetical protein
MRDYPYSVHVIESPSAADLLDQRQEREALRRALRSSGVGIEDYLAVNRATLASALVRAVRTPGVPKARFMIIHLSTHGSPHGIELTSGEEVGWAELGEAFRCINEAVEGRLLLCLSACHGLRALKMVKLGHSLPFGLLVGPTSEVYWTDAMVAFLSFYHLVILKGRLPEAAVYAMNTAAGLPDRFFVAVDGAGALRRLADSTRDRKLRAMRRSLAMEAPPRQR